jgi:hypothetical protein
MRNGPIHQGIEKDSGRNGGFYTEGFASGTSAVKVLRAPRSRSRLECSELWVLESKNCILEPCPLI